MAMMTESVAPTLWSSIDDIKAQPQAATHADSPESRKMEFLNLFMAQLKNQDPLSPMEQQDIAQQMAIFSQLEEGVKSRLLMTEIRDNLKSQMSWQAADWIGKEVRINAQHLPYSGEGKAHLHYILPENAHHVAVQLFDQKGNLVRTFSPAEQGDNPIASGAHSIAWDGQTMQRTQAPAGNYAINVTAFDQTGKSLPGVRTEITGKLDGVEMGGGDIRLKIAGERLRPQDVLEVRQIP